MRSRSARHAGESPAAAPFLDELKATIPIHPMMAATAEIIARIGSEEAG
jgi:hypothetical protein